MKGMRVAGVKTLEQANRYLAEDYLVWWERELTVEAVNPDDAHRPLDKNHHLAASLSHVETRQIRNDYTFRWEGDFYGIEPGSVVSGMRGAAVRVEQRLDGSMAVRFGERYVRAAICPTPAKAAPVRTVKSPRARAAQPGAEWRKNFDLRKGPKIWQAVQAPARRPEGWTST